MAKRKTSSKRKYNDGDDDSLINELKLMAVESLESVILEQNLKGRQLTKMLTSMENAFSQSKLFLTDGVDKEFELTINAFLFIICDMIGDLRAELYTRDEHFNIVKYFNNLKRELQPKGSKRAKLAPVIIDVVSQKQNSLVNYDEEDEEDEEYYDEEGDTEEVTTDEEQDVEITTSSKQLNKDFMKVYKDTIKKDSSDDVMHYFNSLDNNMKSDMINKLTRINNSVSTDKPLLFHIMSLPLEDDLKKTLLTKLNIMDNSMGDNNKLRNWFNNFVKLPLGKYRGIDITNMKKKKVNKFLNSLMNKMNDAVWGHDEAKQQIIQIMAQKIRNPNCNGSVVGIWGTPGNGKTTLIKEGIAKAMKKPFIFISLGGAQDGSYLDGHSYTYEGSIYGRIAQGLIDAQCMDPIFYFDELDKVSETRRGEEIINLLIHLIDPIQNGHFRDKYFHDIDLDLSKATFIFSFNSLYKVNHILLDRITTINTKHLLVPQKQHIAQNYLLPAIMRDMGLNSDNISVPEHLILDIINNYTNEGGVRKMKKILYELVREINVLNLSGRKILDRTISLPYSLEDDVYNKILEDKHKYVPELIHMKDNIGMVNGLWANDLGIGGVLPIESTLIPAKSCMEIKATGSLQKVIKESIDVALSVAWNYTDTKVQEEWMDRWKKYPECFHIHCPDGSVPKDGPSAGAAMGLTIYSQLMNRKVKHNIAMTGEMNLRGAVTRIGGLEEKLTGAKRAGATLVLYPKENMDDIITINKRNPDLICDNFQVVPISTFNEVLQYALV